MQYKNMFLLNCFFLPEYGGLSCLCLVSHKSFRVKIHDRLVNIEPWCENGFFCNGFVKMPQFSLTMLMLVPDFRSDSSFYCS